MKNLQTDHGITFTTVKRKRKAFKNESNCVFIY